MTFGVSSTRPTELRITNSPRVALNAPGPVKAVFLNIYVGEGLERANFTLWRYEEVQPFNLVSLGGGVRIEDNGQVIRFESPWQHLTVEAAWLAE